MQQYRIIMSIREMKQKKYYLIFLTKEQMKFCRVGLSQFLNLRENFPHR